MKTLHALTLSCALLAVACGGSETNIDATEGSGGPGSGGGNGSGNGDGSGNGNDGGEEPVNVCGYDCNVCEDPGEREECLDRLENCAGFPSAAWPNCCGVLRAITDMACGA